MVSSACLDPRPLCSRFCVGAMERSPICVGLPVWLQLLIRNEHEWALEDDFMADENHVRRKPGLGLDVRRRRKGPVGGRGHPCFLSCLQIAVASSPCLTVSLSSSSSANKQLCYPRLTYAQCLCAATSRHIRIRSLASCLHESSPFVPHVTRQCINRTKSVLAYPRCGLCAATSARRPSLGLAQAGVRRVWDSRLCICHDRKYHVTS